MPLFKLQNRTVQTIKESSFDLEKDLQKITEENLEKIFGLKFISSEFVIHGLRIDTLAFDPEMQSFVIIEYKRDRSQSVVDQGFAYLSLLLNNLDSFILEYVKKTNIQIQDIKVDRSQSKVMFLASSFNIHQQTAINFKDIPIELWEVKKYEGGILEFDQLKSPDASASIMNVTKNKTIEIVSREIKKYTIDDHFKNGWEGSKKIYEILSGKILELDSRIKENFNKYFIGFKIGFYNICAINTRKSKLNISLVRVDKNDLKDPEKKVKDIPWRKLAWGKQCRIEILDKKDIDYTMFLIKQVYEKFYKLK
jgi:predicted transport protein